MLLWLILYQIKNNEKNFTPADPPTVYCTQHPNQCPGVVATECKVEHTKGDKIAAVIELPYPVEEVEAAIEEHFSKKGGKSDKSKGFDILPQHEDSATKKWS